MKTLLLIVLLLGGALARAPLTQSPFQDRAWFVEALASVLREEARKLDVERARLELEGETQRAAKLRRRGCVLRNTARLCELEGVVFLRRCILAANQVSELERLAKEVRRRGPGIATRKAIKALAKAVARRWSIVISTFVDALAPRRIQADPDEILLRWAEFRPAERAWAVRVLLRSDWVSERDLRLVARELARRHTSD